jgi:protein-S-isoprenylcysteine O-methyltransferase Ste14
MLRGKVHPIRSRRRMLKRMILPVLLLPVMVTIVVPAVLVYATRQVWSGWNLESPWNLLPTKVGIILIAAGLLMAIWTASLIVRLGKGTPAPWDPPTVLVIEGPYRHMRNPMISSVVWILTGEGVLLGSPILLVWAGVFAFLNLLYIPTFEEKTLAKRFGEPYEEYRQNVPRWVPRFRPWRGPENRMKQSPGEGT